MEVERRLSPYSNKTTTECGCVSTPANAPTPIGPLQRVSVDFLSHCIANELIICTDDFIQVCECVAESGVLSIDDPDRGSVMAPMR